MNKIKLLFLISFLSLFYISRANVPTDFLPRIFQIGEYQVEYDVLVKNHDQELLEACDNDLKIAYGKLSSMFREMELYAENSSYDLKGVRLWLHIFWNQDGTIQYLAYHLRPNSKNIEIPAFEAFLLSFVENYQFPLLSEKSYTLYTSTSFPVYARRRKGRQ
ncbi:MAG: hypothetical protein AAGG68_04310 [Bacteroidota bacterium]